MSWHALLCAPLLQPLPAMHPHAILHLAVRPSSRASSAVQMHARCFSLRVTSAAGAAVIHGPITEEGEVDSDVGGGLCCDAGGDVVWTEAGVCAHRVEEEGFSAVVQ